MLLNVDMRICFNSAISLDHWFFISPMSDWQTHLPNITYPSSSSVDFLLCRRYQVIFVTSHFPKSDFGRIPAVVLVALWHSYFHLDVMVWSLDSLWRLFDGQHITFFFVACPVVQLKSNFLQKCQGPPFPKWHDKLLHQLPWHILWMPPPFPFLSLTGSSDFLVFPWCPCLGEMTKIL